LGTCTDVKNIGKKDPCIERKGRRKTLEYSAISPKTAPARRRGEKLGKRTKERGGSYKGSSFQCLQHESEKNLAKKRQTERRLQRGQANTILSSHRYLETSARHKARFGNQSGEKGSPGVTERKGLKKKTLLALPRRGASSRRSEKEERSVKKKSSGNRGKKRRRVIKGNTRLAHFRKRIPHCDLLLKTKKGLMPKGQ